MLDGIGKRDIGLGHGLLELIEVDGHQVDHLDAMGCGLGHMLLGVATGQQGSMDFGMQGLNASVHHLGVPGELLDGGNGNAGILDSPGRSSRGDDLDAEFVHQRPCEIDHARLVGNRDQRARDLHIRTHAVPPSLLRRRAARVGDTLGSRAAAAYVIHLM